MNETLTREFGPVLTPAERYGPLFVAVQQSGILADGKTFVDAIPRRLVPEILADFAVFEGDDAELLRFVEANFELSPVAADPVPAKPSMPLRDYIRSMWPRLARGPERPVNNSSALAVRHRHVVPGGRFREIYYWDSFFTMLGLVRDGELNLANGIVDTLTDMIETFGHVPNGARTYYVGRSQPPLFYLMVTLLNDQRPEIAARRLAAMKREYAWWMAGIEGLTPGNQINRVAMLADGSILNRYWDPRTTPREESWREDVETARESDRPAAEVYRNLRAGAESGWDFSSRWCDGPSLASIRTTTIAPIDLNSFLYGLEMAIAAAGDCDSDLFAARAGARATAIRRHCWNGATSCFTDFDLVNGRARQTLTAAALTPLQAGIATEQQAASTAQTVHARLLAPGGLRTTQVQSGEQWDLPNGWAPLQWIAISGLQRYGHSYLAKTLSGRWIGVVEKAYSESGLLFEKYDIEAREIGAGGEYPPQVGFGWTNGVVADLIDGGRTV